MVKNDKNNYVVIMAGGVGSRFWPMSTPECPKQFIDVLGCGRTLLQLTADRFREICPPENIWVATSAQYADLVREQLPDIPEEQILKEPCRRSTAPCIAYASWKIKVRNPKATIVATPADHVILNANEFIRVIRSAISFTADSDAIVTLGMKPTRPDTGYGYIEADMSMASPRNKEIFRVDGFREKPDRETAERYLRRNNYFWNSGIFIWGVGTVVAALRVYQPAMSKIFERLLPYYYTDKEQELIDESFGMCEDISIDYAIMEKVDEMFVLPADFGWGDLGTWGSLYERFQKDSQGNTVVGQGVKLFETSNCVIHAAGEKNVIVQGLDGYVVAENNNNLLVCRLSEEQRLKTFLSEEE